MNNIADAIKRFAVALGYGTATTDYTGNNIPNVMKQMAVKMQCAGSVDDVKANDIAGVLDYIAENYGEEEVEPYDLTITATSTTVTVKKNGKTITAGKDRLHNGDKLVVTAVAAEGKTLSVLTLNGTAIESGDEYTVNGHNVTIVATSVTTTYDLARTVDEHCSVAVTKGGNAVADGENVLSHGDVLTITATASEGYDIATLTVNGAAFESGTTLTVGADVAIVATSEAEASE